MILYYYNAIYKKTKGDFWTNHAKDKMRFYKLSEQRIFKNF